MVYLSIHFDDSGMRLGGLVIAGMWLYMARKSEVGKEKYSELVIAGMGPYMAW